jgi:hypothetical protein
MNVHTVRGLQGQCVHLQHRTQWLYDCTALPARTTMWYLVKKTQTVKEYTSDRLPNSTMLTNVRGKAFFISMRVSLRWRWNSSAVRWGKMPVQPRQRSLAPIRSVSSFQSLSMSTCWFCRWN